MNKLFFPPRLRSCITPQAFLLVPLLLLLIFNASLLHAEVPPAEPVCPLASTASTAATPLNENLLATLRQQQGHTGFHGTFHNNYDKTLPDIFDLIRWKTSFNRNTPSPVNFPLVQTDINTLNTPTCASRITWLGHAGFLFQRNGISVLADPIFSQRASPFSFAGPKRITPTPFAPAQLPPIDIVVISHNHYDHLDTETVRAIFAKNGDRTQWLVPLGMAQWFRDLGITHVTEMDWWQEQSFAVAQTNVRTWFVPAQHFSGRGAFDRNKSLWGGWVIEIDGFRFFHAGDTGYSQDFSNIGQVFGNIDLALIPIGAYQPAWLMKPVHITPEEAVRIHQDIHSRFSIGMHWGTFILTDEAMDEPPQRLRAALQEAGTPAGQFIVMQHGEMLVLAQPKTATDNK